MAARGLGMVSPRPLHGRGPSLPMLLLAHTWLHHVCPAMVGWNVPPQAGQVCAGRASISAR
ncbi:hypothetical protein DRV84_14745 [Rhodosalinus sediminis]|uniref:Uncharacterized protein n=1 Tax=Rhodosalinus sediminis TaxID=1940533 RepID=A0A3D9BJK9_9RHOB|nr:hypothetical protein DRV84_14745 [Rhodosalinus sediminis]